MKNKIIVSLLALFVIFGVFSFTILKKRTNIYSIKKTAIVTKKVSKRGSCGAVGSVTAQKNGTYVTISWTTTGGTPYSFNYGGYYQDNTPFPTGNTMATSITIPYRTGGRIGVLAICSDGSSSGNTVNILF